MPSSEKQAAATEKATISRMRYRSSARERAMRCSIDIASVMTMLRSTLQIRSRSTGISDASGPSAALVPVLRERIWRVDRSIVVTDAMPMEQRMGHSLAADRYRMRLMIAFSVAAAGFSLLGIYGVMNRLVARRRRELGVRLALGAQRERILVLVLGEAARLGAAGAALGLLGALLATGALESLIWGVPRLDPLTHVGAAAALLALALLASLAPAHRAAGVEPMRVLRS